MDTSQGSYKTLKILMILGVYAAVTSYRNSAVAIYLTKMGASLEEVGLNGVGQAIAICVFAMFTPRLINKVGYKASCVFALMVECLGVLSLAFSDNTLVWFIARALLGISTATFFAAGEAWLGASLDDNNRGRTMGVYTIILGGGLALGPLVFGVESIFSASRFLMFWLLAGLLTLLLSFTSSTRGQSSSERIESGFFSFLLSAPFIVVLFILIGLKDSAQSTFLPVLGMKLGFNESAAAFMLSSCLAGGLTIPALIGRVSDRVNRRSLLIFLMAAFGTLCIILPYTIHSSLLRAVNCFFIGGFGGGIFAVTMAEIGARFKGAELAVAYAATGALWGVGSVSGNIVLGYTMGLSNVLGYSLTVGVPFVIMAILALGRAIIFRRSSGRALQQI
jgi:MFS family permease